MPDSIDLHINNIFSKLQQLLKKHAALEKENIRLSKENHALQENEINYKEQIFQMQQQLNILKASTGKLEGEEKKNFEKSINGYIRSIERCMAMINN